MIVFASSQNSMLSQVFVVFKINAPKEWVVKLKKRARKKTLKDPSIYKLEISIEQWQQWN